MVNTLFLPEIREMLASENTAELKEFCVALNPGRTAEFMEGLEAVSYTHLTLPTIYSV